VLVTKGSVNGAIVGSYGLSASINPIDSLKTLPTTLYTSILYWNVLPRLGVGNVVV